MTPAPKLRFHHIGLACRTLGIEQRAHELLGYVCEGDRFVDPIQQVEGLFMTHGAMRLELLAPRGDDSPLQDYLSRGTRLYHEAFETADIAASLSALDAGGARLVVGPVPAVAFGGREIAFLMLRSLSLVELIQADLSSHGV
jgi:methylmalonyl-CoA/ethylmalonyl-CoA epimerase